MLSAHGMTPAIEFEVSPGGPVRGEDDDPPIKKIVPAHIGPSA